MSGSGLRISDSRLLARSLSGSWRADPEPLDLSIEEFSLIAPLLVGSGAGGLGWNRVRLSSLRGSKVAQELQHAYRLFKLKARLHEREIQKAFNLLRSESVEPILIKGWSIARLYPDSALRPYTDVDMIVRPEDYERAKLILANSEEKIDVDLHEGAAHLDEYETEEAYARSVLVRLGDAYVRVPSYEDHLRMLAVHWLHHGAFKPAGLCDIALLIETRPDDFDWSVCLGGSRKRSRWIACTIRLAGELLDANLEGVPGEVKRMRLPHWLLPSILRIWQTPCTIDNTAFYPLADHLRHPVQFIKEAKKRWPPNPIQATIVMNGSFNEMPRLPYQLANYFSRFFRFAITGRGTRRND